MVEKNNATVIQKKTIPVGGVVGTFTFLRDMGKKLKEEEAISVKADDASEAKKIQNRWRAYFKSNAHSRKEATLDDGKVIVYLWLEDKKE